MWSYAGGEPVIARRAGLAARIGRRLAKRKAVVGLAVALLVAVVAGALFAGIQATVALEQAERRADELRAREAEQERAALVQRALLALMRADEAMAHPNVDAPALQAELDALSRDVESELGRSPDDAQLHFALGGCRRFLGDAPAADAAYAEALRCDPGFAEAHIERARMSLEKYISAVLSGEADPTLRERAGSALREAAQLGIGRPQLKRTVDCYEFFARGDGPALEKACDEGLRLGGRVEDFAFLGATTDLMATDAARVESAEKRLTQALRVHPNHSGALKARTVARFRLRRLDDALADISRVVELYPRDPDAWWMRAVVQRFRGDPKAALADAERAAELQPGSASMLSERAAVKEDLNDDGGALRDYGLAISARPEDPVLYYNRAIVLSRLGDLAGALADLGRAVELRPDYLNGWINRGALHVQMGSFENAVVDLTRALELDPRRFEAHFNRGHAFAALGRYAEAAADYGRVLDLAPDDWPQREVLEGVLAELRRRLEPPPDSDD